MESIKTGKKMGYLRFKNDTCVHQIDYSKKTYKTVGFSAPNERKTAPVKIPKKKRNITLSEGKDSLICEGWKNDSLAGKIIDIMILRYQKWPSGLMPENIIPAKITWSNRKVVLLELSFKVDDLDRILFSVPGDFEERKNQYKARPD